MKQIMIGIFAHPDDEAFGPSGTLLSLGDDGHDIHLILLTDGEAGTNPGTTDLSIVRREEWDHASRLLGTTSTARLGLADGQVPKTSTSQLDAQLAAQLDRIISSYDEPVELSLMTFEPNGVTGHFDHISASEATTRLFEIVATGGFSNATPGKLWYYCLSKDQAPLEETPYYHNQARPDSYINHRVNVSSVLSRKYQVIDSHASQISDATNLKALGDDLLSTECFHIVSQDSTDLVS